MDSEEDERTIWCGNISDRVTEELLYELFLQAAPVQRVKIPKDKDGKQTSYAFVILKHSVSVLYTIELLNRISLYGRPLNLKKRTTNSSQYNQMSQRISAMQNNMNTVGPNDFDKLMNLGGQMVLNNLNVDNINEKNRNYGGPWERNSHVHREEKRNESNPYRSKYERRDYSRYDDRDRRYGHHYHNSHQNRRRY